jgi:hypothetical protein
LESEDVYQVIKHPLFKILNGHPLAITIVSSLRNHMSLVEIYEYLKLIKKNLKFKNTKFSDLTVALSIEAAIVFAKKANPLTKEILAGFAAVPSGLLKKD